jgi:uncharacterized protein YcfL
MFRKSLKLFLVSALLVSCSSEVEINCESGNMSALLDTGKQFVLDNIASDSTTSSMTFNNFKVASGSCEANKREKYVRYRLTALVRQSNKDRPISFNCKYVKADKKVACQMQ